MKKLLVSIMVLSLCACKDKKPKVTIDATGLQYKCVHRLTDVIVYDIFTPPVASRIYAYSNLAFYEAIRFNQSGNTSLAISMKGFEAMPQPEAGKEYEYSLAAARAFFDVARTLTFSKDSLRKTEDIIYAGYKEKLDDAVFNRSFAFGDSVAATILKRAATDNYKITRGMPRYSVFRETGKWQQTPPDYADAVEPNWRLIKPLLMDSASQFKPVPPIPYSLDKKSAYYKELLEVYEVNKNISPLQDTIAHYWDDNPFVTEHRGHLMFATKKTTPGGHWMGIISILTGQLKTDLVRTAKVYAITSAAMFDGFISCWDEKYRSQTIRPISVIREQFDPNWNPLLQTPPFPEYTSGHSVVSSAAATVLEGLLGKNIAFHDTTEMEYLGLERSFPSISAASEEAGISRLYGGIHYMAAIREGKKQGQSVGELYLEKLTVKTSESIK